MAPTHFGIKYAKVPNYRHERFIPTKTFSKCVVFSHTTGQNVIK